MSARDLPHVPAPPARSPGRPRLRVVRRLARPATPADRRRWTVVAIACGVLTTVLLLGASVARVRGSGLGGIRYDDSGQPIGQPLLSPLLQDTDLRPGVVAAAVLACLPPLVLLLQALRVGSAARGRRLSALRVAGASRAHLRLLAGAEGASAGVVGAVAGVLAYLLVGASSRSAGSQYLRIVPPLDRHDLWVTAVAVLSVALLAAWAARTSARDVQTAPQRVRSSPARPLPRRRAVTALGCAAMPVPVLFFGLSAGRPASTGAALLTIALAVAALLLGAPFLVLAAARRAARTGDAMALLAAGRVAADPRAPGRAGAVVAVCAAAIAGGITTCGGVAAMAVDALPDDAGFYLSGAGLTVAVALGALLICVVSLVVGASEQVRDAARSTAVLVAFGVGRDDLRRALVRQLQAVTLPSAAIGAATTAVFVAVSNGGSSYFWAAAALGFLVAVAAVLGAARLSALLVQPQVDEATSADNLRTA